MAASKPKTRSPVASAIKALRERRGLTQEQFAKELGVSLPTIGKYETTHKPGRAMLNVFTRMAKESGMPELVPTFEKAGAAPMSKDSLVFAGYVCLDVAKTHLIDTNVLLNTLRRDMVYGRCEVGKTREQVKKLEELQQELKGLESIVSQLLTSSVLDRK